MEIFPTQGHIVAVVEELLSCGLSYADIVMYFTQMGSPIERLYFAMTRLNRRYLHE